LGFVLGLNKGLIFPEKTIKLNFTLV